MELYHPKLVGEFVTVERLQEPGPWWNYGTVFHIVTVLLTLVGVLYVALGWVVIPARVMGRMCGWPPYGLMRTMQNLSLPAWAHLILIGWLAVA